MDGREKRTKVKAVLLGALVYLTGVIIIALTGTLLGAMAAYNASQRGDSQQQVMVQFWNSVSAPGFLLICLSVAVVFTLLGGYVAARASADSRPALLARALPVGLLSLFTSILFTLFAPVLVPVWFLSAALLLPIPLALAGGYLGGVRRASAPSGLELDLAEEDEFYEDEQADDRAAQEELAMSRTKHEQETAQSVGQLVQQRRERELERQQKTVEERKHVALREALEQSKAEACEDMRVIVREAFLSHPAATEEDFERCWPSIRDEMFKQYALDLYNARAPHTQEKV